MIRGESILCFAPEKWGHIWRNRHQIMSRLARHNKILFIEPRPYLREVWQSWRGHKLSWRDIRGPSVTLVQENLWVYHSALYAPLSGRFPFSAIFRWVRETQLKRTMRELGFERPILWLCRPYMADVVGRFREKLVIYHVVDEYAAYEAEFTSVYNERRRAEIEQKERDLLQAADLVIVTSNSLLERKKAYNPHTYWVPNGVDYEAFASAARKAEVLPSDLVELPRPIIGYIGAINEKLDYSLLKQVAESFPQCSLILVGPIDLRLDFSGLTMLQQPNIHFLGVKPVSEVPYYVAACQVCLMPYKVNEWTAYIDPLKLYEYLAAGKPIVSTAIPAAQNYREVIRVAEGADAFCEHIREALSENDERLVQRRMELASQNSWEERVARISELICAMWQQKAALGCTR